MALSFGESSGLFQNSNADDVGIGRRKDRTLSLSMSGHAFVADSRSNGAKMRYQDGEIRFDDTGTGEIWASISLPHNSIVTSVKVIGNRFTWEMRRGRPSHFPTEVMASGNNDVKDISITGAVIDHDKYVYWFVVQMNTESQLYGAVIEYEN